MYIYRANRIILFGGWNGIVKKGPRLQLARLRVEVGNSIDHLLHLNVAKSQVVVPHELRNAFEAYIDELKIEAEREYYNRGIRKFSGEKSKLNAQLFERSYSNKGSILELNENYPFINSLLSSFDGQQKTQFKMLLKMINTKVNKIRHVHDERDFIGLKEKDGLDASEILRNVEQLLASGISKEMIKEDILPNLGYKINSLPEEILTLLN
jgi:hypothetical protein